MILRVQKAFASQGLTLSAETLSKVARSVQQVSNQFVESEGSLTPWKTSEQALAYISYFMVLNGARLKDLWREVERFGLAQQVSDIWDIGSGPGTLQWMLEEVGWQGSLHNVEHSLEAIRWHQAMRSPDDKINSEWTHSVPEKHHLLRCNRLRPPSNVRLRTPPVGLKLERLVTGNFSGTPQFNPTAKSLGVFSYSLLELNSTEIVKKFDHLLIVEPSTQTRARKLMELRAELIQSGYKILAPCTHQLGCPLLLHSNKDWCHHRCYWDDLQPPYWAELEAHLPMKNRTLTYSYLLATRDPIESGNYLGRVIGDTLPERGKVRQLVCRNEKREFLSWLTRKGDPEQIPHGALITDFGDIVEKGGELRIEGKNPTWV